MMHFSEFMMFSGDSGDHAASGTALNSVRLLETSQLINGNSRCSAWWFINKTNMYCEANISLTLTLNVLSVIGYKLSRLKFSRAVICSRDFVARR